MTPAEAIADLDAALAADGEPVRLRRLVLGPLGAQIPTEVRCQAFVRATAAGDLRGSGQPQQSFRVVMSPTEITAAQWPGGTPNTASADRHVPKKGDMLITARGPLTVQAAAGCYIGAALVRLDLEALG